MKDLQFTKYQRITIKTSTETQSVQKDNSLSASFSTEKTSINNKNLKHSYRNRKSLQQGIPT